MKPGSIRQGAFSGVLLASTAFVMWGLSPLFWKQLGAVPSFEIIMHRMVWSFLFLMPLLVILNQWRDFLKALGNRRTTLLLCGTTLIVGGNWLAFIWAINHDMVLQASLGYYINPLVNVLLGMVFLKERLRPLQIAAVFIAGCGVLYLTFAYGRFPWVALFLAFSFGFYGLLRKTAPVGALVGLSVETFLLSIPALFYLFYLEAKGVGAFNHMGPRTDLFLSMTALLTALPLLLFTTGARLLNLSTIGFLQYIAPTCSFLLAIFVFKETAVPAQMITFAAIWVALAVFTLDGLLHRKRRAANSG